MRPRVLYDLSQHLALRLEKGMEEEEGDGQRIPVYLCHPLDPLEDGEDPESALGVLYLLRLTPERGAGPCGAALLRGGSAPPQPQETLPLPSLWMRARFVFLLLGGDLEVRLTAFAAALQTLHEESEVRLEAVVGDGGEAAPAMASEDLGGRRGREEGEGFPLRLVNPRASWRQLGLPEHRLTLAFDVTFAVPSRRSVTLERTFERRLLFETGASEDGHTLDTGHTLEMGRAPEDVL